MRGSQLALACSTAGLALVVSVAATQEADAATPQATIKVVANATNGMAPFAVHVHGLDSELGSGNLLTARFEWSFGDSAGAHNKLVGWSAAHVYDQPGTYTIKLKITNQNGLVDSDTVQVQVTSADRTTIYVSENGNNANPGTQSAPVRTAAHAFDLLEDDGAIRFRRGHVHVVDQPIEFEHENVLIGAYGNGPRPIIKSINSSPYVGMIGMGEQSENVIIEDLRFDSPFAPSNLIVRALQPNGENVTVRDCHFDDVSYAVNAEREVERLLVMDNTAGVLGAYFIWGDGSDHAYIGNDVNGSLDEHNIRLGGVTRSLIAGNDLTNTSKTTIWCMLGKHCYIVDNTLRKGRMVIGPNFASGSPSERFRYVVAEANDIRDEGVILYSGAEHAMFRNNVIRYHDGDAFSVWGYIPNMDRTVKDVKIFHNTAINNQEHGCFMKIGADALELEVRNNLYHAPHLNMQDSAANVFCDDTSLGDHMYCSNLWAVPEQGSDRHRLSTGLLSAGQWSSLNQTSLEEYRNFASGDLNDDYEPQFDADDAHSIKGVHVDFYGQKRPKNGSRTFGAVELP